MHIFIEVVGVNRLLVIPPGVVVACVLTTKERTDTMPKKRANGEGSIRKRKDGRWEGRYDRAM